MSAFEPIDDALWDYTTNWFKVPRALVPILVSRPLALQIYAILASRARHVPATVQTPRGDVVLDVGQAMFGLDRLATQCGSTVAKVRTALSFLEKQRILTTKSTSSGTIATLARYKESHLAPSAESQAESQGDRKETTSSSQGDRKQIASSSQGDRKETATNKTSDVRDDKDDQDDQAGERGETSSAPPLVPEVLEVVSPLQIVIEDYNRIFQEQTGGLPTWTEQTRAAAQKLLEHHSPEEIARRAHIMHFKSSGMKWPKPPYEFGTLAKHFDMFAKPCLTVMEAMLERVAEAEAAEAAKPPDPWHSKVRRKESRTPHTVELWRGHDPLGSVFVMPDGTDREIQPGEDPWALEKEHYGLERGRWSKPEPAPPSRTDIDKARAAYAEAFVQCRPGSLPTWSLQTEGLIAELVKAGHSAAEIAKRARVMFQRPADEYPTTRDLATLVKHFDTFAPRANEQVRGLKLLGAKPPNYHDDDIEGMPNVVFGMQVGPSNSNAPDATPTDRLEPGDAARAWAELAEATGDDKP